MKVEFLTHSDLNQMKSELINKMTTLIGQLTNKSQKDLFTENQLCEYLDVCKSTIQNYRRTGKIDYIQISNKIYFKKIDVDAFLDKHYTKNIGYGRN